MKVSVALIFRSLHPQESRAPLDFGLNAKHVWAVIHSRLLFSLSPSLFFFTEQGAACLESAEGFTRFAWLVCRLRMTILRPKQFTNTQAPLVRTSSSLLAGRSATRIKKSRAILIGARVRSLAQHVQGQRLRVLIP